VINGATDQVTASILFGLLSDPTGIAVNPATNTIYVSSSGYSAAEISVIKGTTNTVAAIIPLPAGDYPVALAADPNTNTIAVAASYAGGGGVLMINGATRTVTTEDLLEPQEAVGIDTSTEIYYSEGLGDLNAVNVFQQNTTSAFTFSAGFEIPVIGLSLSAQTGYDNEGQVKYHFFRAGNLCGTNGYPGQIPRRLVAKHT
jgi:DNA-binding beta-propeller fold protein YncE